ncbi:protein Daple-like isoform X2 [Myxocyprinus asiaticus]|uniref:protein Daple-like isoform X2 n=1 Tax=Myxocyprinus asiaticus TaxID=70543 RepID=UPI002221A604|nr:protein Daple-like isoform X2 [Myxocyprinus asiaticus]
MDITVSELMSNFMDSPLVVWVKTFGPLGSGSEDKLSMFMDLVDGVFLHKIMTHIDPSPMNQRVNKHVNNDVNLRIQNLNTVIRQIKNYYQEHLQQLILMNLPNVLAIAKDPLSDKSMEEVKRLLLLILGCAVQCERKEEIIEKIKLLDIETQSAIVTHIQEVTHNQENVLDLQWLEVGEMPAEQLDPLSRTMAFHLRKLIDERDDSSELILELTQERDYLQSQQPSSLLGFPSPEHTSLSPITLLSKEDRQHLAVELADTKAKLRRSRQELEEKTEQLIDAKNEIERLDTEIQKLKQENMQLLAEARSVRAYRDEVDSLRERAGKVDRLETELTRCKERLNDVHFYKTRIEEMREDNITLLETKSMLEEQLTAARGRCDKLHELEKENLQLRSKLHDMEIDRDSNKKRLEELLEENMLLEISQKQSMNESAHLGWELEQLAKNNEVNDARKSFVFELNESASSRLLKLEKENQCLQSTIQELREASINMEEGQLHAVKLERENQSLSKMLERLQSQLDQEKQTTQDMESLGEELLKDKQRLEKSLETLQADKDRQISELEQEKEHLTQAVTSLRKRAQVNSEARVREVETENRILHQTISETGGKLARLEAEKRQATKELESLRERGEHCEELEREVTHLERVREQLQREAAFLKISSERSEALERENATLEQDNRRMKRFADTAQNASLRLAVLEKDHQQLEEENLEQQRMLETLRPATARLAQLQQEHAELEREHEEMIHTLEELRSQAKRSKRLEINCSSLSQENQRLQQTLDNSATKIQGLEGDLRQNEAKTKDLQQELEELRQAVIRAQVVEKEKRGIEQELGQAEKERKQLEKESRRLRQQLEVKEAALEESCLRLASMEKEGTALSKELSRLKEATGRLKELERENKDLQKQATMDKKTLATLREDLVNEKLSVQQQCNELEKLSHELDKIGLNREKLLQEEYSCEDNKYKILETKIESALKKTLELREEKIQSLESRLEESSSLNQQLRTELTTVKKNLEALKQRQEEEAAHSELSQQTLGQARPGPDKEKRETEQREATAELLKMKDRLLDVEKNNAALQTEKQLLKEQLKQLDSQNAQLNGQTLALQKQAASLQEHNTSLHKETAKLQVENSTLSSHSSSLTAQYGALQAQLQTLESEAESLQKQCEEACAARDRVTQDHERLLSVHERQASEYERLIAQHKSLKGSQRALEQEHHALESKYTVLLKQKEAMEALEESLHRERESLREEIHKNTLILGENHSLREEIDRLSQTHTHLRQEYDSLQLQTKELKTSLNESQLELNRWQARYDQLKEKHQGLDISMTKLDNHCELLTRLKGNLEEENHHLLSQIQMLSQQNQTLLERTMESKELYHEEQKQYIDKLNSLRRQKEKLEEKIMDQYKFYDPTPKKSRQWVGAKTIAKLIKPKKENSRERVDGPRERIRNAPDIPLPEIPTAIDCPESAPPTPPPPLPPRQTRLSLDSMDNHSTEENHILSPTLSPALNSRVFSDSGGSRGREAYRSVAGSSESMNGHEELVRWRGRQTGATCSTPLSRNSHNASSCFSSSSLRLGHRIKGLVSEEDLRHHSLDAGFCSGVHRNTGHRPSSAEFSRNTSSSNSPVSSKGSLDCLQGRSASLSSDDVIGLGHEGSRLSQISLIPRSSTLPCDTPSAQRLSQHPSSLRPSSPDSEMVTLEEFLQESNALSPPTVQTGIREDLLTDYFTRSARPAPLRDGAKTPTNYVMPTIKTTLPELEGRAPKPGHSVKPSVRHTETSMPPSQSQTLPNRGAGSRPSPLQQSSPHGGVGGSTSLSRTFSLASADLLHSNGPNSYRAEASSPNQSDVVRRSGAVTRERPLSARLPGSSPLPADPGHLSVDPRRLSLAPPRDELSLTSTPPLHSSSMSLQAEQDYVGSSSRASAVCSGAAQTRPPPHHGEVAMVTPVRAISALRLNDLEEEPREPRQTESPLLKKADTANLSYSVKGQPTSKPASPDPNNDPQTVWYEYGCV